jgi:hypothetical protein
VADNLKIRHIKIIRNYINKAVDREVSKSLKSIDVVKVDPMVGATADADGTSGTVPAPSAGDQNKFLRGDGTWASISVNVDGSDIDIPTKVSQLENDAKYITEDKVLSAEEFANMVEEAKTNASKET